MLSPLYDLQLHWKFCLINTENCDKASLTIYIIVQNANTTFSTSRSVEISNNSKFSWISGVRQCGLNCCKKSQDGIWFPDFSGSF